jgi:pimeloyl-ACP methyl ester carboxylesterase
VDGVRIRYAVSDGPAERTVLLTSPWPGSIHAFAPIWPALAGRFRLLAVDLPGFGASDARADLSAPPAMGAFLIRLIEDWELGRPHLVAPDVGTSAALFAALQSPGSVTSVAAGIGRVAIDPALAGRLGEIETPVMVFAGSRDRLAPPGNGDFLAQRLRNCQLAMLGAGHSVWEEVPDAFAQLLGEWVEEHG